MYLVNSRREASLLIPESQPVAVSSVAQRLQDQVTPSLFALWERAKSAVAVLPEEPPAQEMPEGEAAIVSEMQQVPLEQEPPSDPSVINGVIAAGFTLTGLAEPEPEKALLETVPGMIDETRRPAMLIVSAIKNR